MRLTSEQMNNLLDNIAEAVVVANALHNIIFLNKAAEKMFGYRVADVLGRPLDALVPERFVSIHHKHIRDFALAPETTQPMERRRDLRARRKDGTEFPVEIGIAKMGEGEQEIFTACAG